MEKKASWMKSIFRLKSEENISDKIEEKGDYKVINGVWVNQAENEPKNDDLEAKSRNEKGERISDLDMITAFCDYLESKGLIKTSVIAYRSDLKIWANFAKKRKCFLEQLKIEDIEKFFRQMDRDTARRKIASLRSFAKWRLRNNFSDLFIECEKIEYKAKKIRLPKSFDFDEYHKIIDVAKDLGKKKDRRGIWLGLMSQCGLRIGEIKSAVLDSKKGFIRVIGKGNKERITSCPEWLINAIKNDEKGSYRRIRQLVDTELKKLGYKRFHRLRHTYASKLLHEKIPIDKIKDLLGHASISTTQIYLKREILENAHEYIDKK